MSDNRWKKTKHVISKWFDLACNLNATYMDIKNLFSDGGFLAYIARTYEVFTPYLKWIHLIIDRQRPNRDSESWKYPELDSADNKYIHQIQPNLSDYPIAVFPVLILKYDLNVLKILTQSEKPPVLLIHINKQDIYC